MLSTVLASLKTSHFNYVDILLQTISFNHCGTEEEIYGYYMAKTLWTPVRASQCPWAQSKLHEDLV